jgi:hypothetical protein
LTHLKLNNLEQEEPRETLKFYGGFYKYLSSFPNSKHLVCTCNDNKPGLIHFIIDLPLLMESAQQLVEELHVRHYRFIASGNLSLSSLAIQGNLKILKLDYLQMDLNTVSYIIDKLNVENLRLAGQNFQLLSVQENQIKR